MKLLLGDCLEQMKTIEDGSVDMILTDPPYGTTACKWDNVIPFEPMWQQIWRVLKPNGGCLLFGCEPFSSALRMSQIKRFRYDWVWDKQVSTNFLNAWKQPLRKIEMISVFSTGSERYYPQIEDKPIKNRRTLKGDKSGSDCYGKFGTSAFTRTIPNDKMMPTNLVSFPRVMSNKSKFHPTQKPVPLLEYLIKTYTLEGETVLDFTMGSGSTGVACVNTGRKFIGIEMDENYFEIASKRIAEAKPAQELW